LLSGINNVGQVIGSNYLQGFIAAEATCFAKGTRISTSSGMVCVEDLKIADLVHCHFAGIVPVLWTGYRRLNCKSHPDPRKVWPVRVKVGAFGEALPHRDLWLSPNHAVFVDDILVPIKHLINGTTVKQVPVDEITYYHIELSQHDVLLAEGLPAESYLDTGQRSEFMSGPGPVALHPDFSSPAPNLATMWEAEGCAPLIVTGPVLAAVRARLLQRAAKLATHSMRGSSNARTSRAV
jgi:hypothetical protein